jgi:hypothetical protein
MDSVFILDWKDAIRAVDIPPAAMGPTCGYGMLYRMDWRWGGIVYAFGATSEAGRGREEEEVEAEDREEAPRRRGKFDPSVAYDSTSHEIFAKGAQYMRNASAANSI